MTACLLCLLMAAPAGSPPELARALQVLRAVGPEGHGNAAASAAWRVVARSEASSLPEILIAFDGAGQLAANWIRAAVDAIGERELAGGGSLPLRELEAHVLDIARDPRGRRLAYEWLVRADAAASERIIPRVGDDPCVELRRDAVARILGKAEERFARKESRDAVAEYRRALDLARDADQIRTAASRLRELGEPVDLQRHFGFLSAWHLIGPFDNTGSKSFDRVFPPEREIDLGAAYSGKSGEIRWIGHRTEHEYGLVDLNQALGRHKGAIAYALSEFTSEEAADVEIRLGCIVAWKLWVNGELIFGHEEYHHGMELDQFRVQARLRRGRNHILLKVCQNEQTESFAQEWRFQLRICDAAGTAILPAAAEDPRPAGGAAEAPARGGSADKEKEAGS